MNQLELVHETLTDSLRHTISALGGTKAVASALWPEKAADEAARLLADCINPDRAARLPPDHLVLLMKLSRAKGIHTVFGWMARELGYADPVPVEPEDELAQLQREFMRSVEMQSELVKRMERLNSRTSFVGRGGRR